MAKTRLFQSAILSVGVAAISCGSTSGNAAQNDLPTPVRDSARCATAPIASPSDLEAAFSEASDRIKPAVVSITTVRKVKAAPQGALPFNDPFFERFFQRPRPRGKLEQRGIGSGVIVDDQGHILTNNHVVQGADELEVQLADDREVKAEVIGTDPKTDLAVIKIDAGALAPATLGDSQHLRVGQWVLAVGSPFGLSQTVSAGIVSAIGRGGVGITDYEDFIQTDAAINPGNSGGPLIDLGGNVVGINTAIATRNGGNMGIGFAVPMHMARKVMRQLIDDGKVVRGWLGVLIQELQPELAKTFGYGGEGGILVQDVVPDGPGKAAGLREGDIIVERDGVPVGDVSAFRNAIAQMAPGTEVKLQVWRDQKHQPVTVELGELADDGEGPGSRTNDAAGPIGLSLHDLDDGTRQRFGIEAEQGAVVVRIEPGSVAAKAGLRVGDVIERIGSDPVKSAADASAQLRSEDLSKGVRIRVRRGKFGHFVVLRREE